ncbi:MAG: hypothetical protein HKO95_13985 [Rhodobacteraceae bacterium]|jgi:hypothetical protein|nr:hypothetical protein [Alphaproteobacteria bacterium]MBT8476791.1 hypothetical protein [Alphaproteobacteria bacterium]NNF71524.1 hypothetical protein [Paracoccaceae bacterium]NNK67833.1 hypothetical protein [Paracoccaceae bacterium]
MYARITPYKMKHGARDSATELMHELKGQIMALPGMQHFINVTNEDGSGYVVAVVDSKETAEASADNVKALWANFAEHLERMPTPSGYDVMANWSN